MTNPLEQIRELAERWQVPKGNSDIHLAGIICGNEILKILNASQGYECVLKGEVPDVMKERSDWDGYSNGYVQGWNCCRDAMLAASKETNRE